jgi:hypothetical protein
MPSAPIRFGDLQGSGFDELSGAPPIAMNVLMDAAGTVRRRPGIQSSSLMTSTALSVPGSATADKSVIWLHETLGGDIFAACESGGIRDLFFATPSGALNLSSGSGLEKLAGTRRPKAAETEMLLVLAGGAEMQKIVLSGPTSSRLAGSPPAASDVIGNSSRLLANDVIVDATKVRYSDIAQGTTTYAGHEVWTFGVGTAGFFTAEAQPDPVVALGTSTNEVLVFGSRTIQVYNSDPTLVFAPVSTIEHGCGAPDSVVKVDQSFFLLDNKKRFIRTDGRQMEVISTPIRRTIESMSVTDDCFGYRVMIGAYDCVVWTFPTDGRTFVYQVGVGWSQWSATDLDGNNVELFGTFPVTSHFLHSTGANLIGTEGGLLRELSLSAQTDNGERFTAYAETGYLNNGTESRKLSRSMRFVLRRGETSSSTSPVAYFGWRDQPGDWAARLPIELGAVGDTEAVVQFHSLGVYRHRQWFFEFSGTAELVLVSATETFEVIEDSEE